MLLAGSGNLQAADTFDAELAQIQRQWAVIKYQTAEQSQDIAFERLSQTAHSLSERHPNRAESLVWESIVLSSHAGSRRGLDKMGALSEVEQARDLLLKAEKIDATLLGGSVYTSLGALYAKVPGWPLGFGNKKKAHAYLQKALALNPKGIDPNYFMGELLFEQNKYQDAYKMLQKAQQSPQRPMRKLADQGRHKEIKKLMSKIKRFM